MWVRTDDNEIVNLHNVRRVYRKGKTIKAVWGPMDEVVMTTAMNEENAQQIMERINLALSQGATHCTLG